MYTNEYLISSNNSINENKYNTEKVQKTTSYKLKKILKPILRLLKASNSNNNNNKKHQQAKECSFDDSQWSSEMNDNSANELLEEKLLNEINNCMEDAAIYVYNDNACRIQPVQQDQSFIPVHFARTEAGTFFWTTVQRPADCDLIEPTCYYSEYQEPQLQYGDRWVQA